MKLRIKGNTLRIRLSQSEVELLGNLDELKDETNFGESTLGYIIRPVENGPLVNFDDNNIVIGLAGTSVTEWARGDEVSIEFTKETSTGDLQVLIEKDFQCLHKRPGEDESDLFRNPAAEKQTN